MVLININSKSGFIRFVIGVQRPMDYPKNQKSATIKLSPPTQDRPKR